jgi:F0F1-type ATP synthase epsilon subunit
MNGKYMKQIVPPGYAIPKAEIDRLTEELRKARAEELACGSEKDRARIEMEIRRAVRRKLTQSRLGWRRLF